MSNLTQGRVEGAQRFAESWVARYHTNWDGNADKTGGVILMLVGVIEELKERENARFERS